MVKIKLLSKQQFYFGGAIYMSKNTMGIMKGMGVGLAVGMAAGFTGSQMMKNNKQMKRKANKALDAMGSLIDNVQYMMK